MPAQRQLCRCRSHLLLRAPLLAEFFVFPYKFGVHAMTIVGNVPVYRLYGEQEQWPAVEMVHCESIANRSRLHDWHIRPHRHSGLFQILFIERGSAYVQLDGRWSAMQSSHVLMVPQFCIHGFEFSEGTIGQVVTLAYPLLNKLAREINSGLATLSSPSILTLGGDTESIHITMTFAAIESEYHSRAPHRNTLIEALVGTLMIRLARHATQMPAYATNSAQREHLFADFCKLLEEGYVKHHPTQFYAKHIGITSAYLNVLCRKMVGKSTLEVINDRVLLEAKRKLIYTSMTISAMSYAIGFSDPAYFTRFFKRGVGCSPKEFRRRAELR